MNAFHLMHHLASGVGNDIFIELHITLAPSNGWIIKFSIGTCWQNRKSTSGVSLRETKNLHQSRSVECRTLH